jgi:hypothetical protein
MRAFVRRPGRKSLLVAITATAALGIAAVAFAATFTCTGGPCVGTNADDTIVGSATDDHISARAGGDSVDATQGGDDTVTGGPGDDTLGGGGDDGSLDIINGGLGVDTIGTHVDHDSDDAIYNGGVGNDHVVHVSNSFTYELYGGPNADQVVSGPDGGDDTVNGGGGLDLCRGDAEGVVQDNFVGCETIQDNDPVADGI